MPCRFTFAALCVAVASSSAFAQARDSTASIALAPLCADASTWNTPQRPFRIHGSTYFVGTHCLSAILVTSANGHVLIDGALPASAAPIRSNIEALGFRMSDVRLILNSHAHYDHAGGIAVLQRASNAVVAASEPSARVMKAGTSGFDDPQYGVLQPFPAVETVVVIGDGDVLTLGSNVLTAHHTGGHTPGGTSWSWPSCENGRCVEVVYADSQTPVSATGFLFSTSRTYPAAVQDFRTGQALFERMKCDILLTPHPGASQLWERVAARDAGNASALIDSTACKRFGENARSALERRLATEKAAK